MLFDRVIRAWKDPEFRQSLSEEDLASMPENPAGAIELSDEELEMAAGGHRPSRSFSASSNSSNSSNSSSNSHRSSSRRSSDKSHRRPSHRRVHRHSHGSWRRRRW